MDYASKTVVENSPCGRFVRYSHMLGRGASKEVYLGFDHGQNIQVAWNRIVFSEEEVTKSTQETLFDEAKLLTSLNHERVMHCFSYWFDSTSKTLNMITELFPSGSLKEYLKRNRSSVQSANIKNWGRQILEGLRYLHTQCPKTIIHRDIKCDNIFVDGDGKQVKLGDLGVATRVNKGGFTKEFKGTPPFMAPEYFCEEYNELVDIYAFGMCLLEMVTGELPYKECSSTSEMFNKAIIGVKPAAIGKIKDSRVKNIIDKCLRPMSLRPSAEELLKDPFFLYNGASAMGSCLPFAFGGHLLKRHILV